MTDKIKNADAEAFQMCMHDSVSGSTLINPGLTKREYFAAMAMQSIVMLKTDQPFEVDAKLAVKYADSLLSELENKQP